MTTPAPASSCVLEETGIKTPGSSATVLARPKDGPPNRPEERPVDTQATGLSRPDAQDFLRKPSSVRTVSPKGGKRCPLNMTAKDDIQSVGVRPMFSSSNIKRWVLAVLVFSLLALVWGCRSLTGPDLEGGILATFDVNGERYSIFITNADTIKDVFALQNGKSAAHIPNGLVVRGAKPYNKPWSWHIDPEQVAMAEATIEINDGSVSGVESDLDGWVGRYYGPWAAELVSVKDYR